MVNALGQAEFENLCLQSAFQEVLETQTEHVVKLHLRLIQYTDADQSTQKSIACAEKNESSFL